MRERQTYGHRRAAAGTRAGRLNSSAVRGHKGIGNPQSEPRAARRGRGAFSAEKSIQYLAAFRLRQSDALVTNGRGHAFAVRMQSDLDFRIWRRVFGRVVDDLKQRLLDQA